MAVTAEEILTKNGYTEEQIKGLDPKLMTAIASVLAEAAGLESSATARVSEAQDIERRYNHMYHSEIVPALNQWGTDKANLEATVEFYRKQNEAARTAGFVPRDAPGYAAAPPAAANPNPNPDPPRGGDGRYVAGANAVPGSPAVFGDLVKIASEADWARDSYTRLYGEAMPEDYDFHATVQEAGRQGVPFRDFFDRKFKLADKRKELAEKRQKEHDDAIRKDERQKFERERAESGGTNPNLRPASASQFSRVRKAVETGKAKDPLMMSADARRQQTNQMIHADIAERESQGSA